MSVQIDIKLEPLPGAMPVCHAMVDAQQWLDFAREARSEGGRLVALWGSDQTDRRGGLQTHMTVATRTGLTWLTLAIDTSNLVYPDVVAIFPAADRMQRATFDLLGLRATEGSDRRQWLRHGAWPANI